MPFKTLDDLKKDNKSAKKKTSAGKIQKSSKHKRSVSNIITFDDLNAMSSANASNAKKSANPLEIDQYDNSGDY
ncbi:hypothetical protein ACN47E_005043 [Coniothyrium glycines]